MRIAVLGTGHAGRTVVARLDELGHDCSLGTNDVAATRARSEYAPWEAGHPGVRLASFADAASAAELVVNATAGVASVAILEQAGADALAGKVLLDLANPLDMAQGMPPLLFPSNTDSLGEQIQRAFPGTRVVKALNTVTASVMVDPARLGTGHIVFVAGEDAGAKAIVADLLGQFGWTAPQILDLGGIRAARALEMYLPLWVSLYRHLGTPEFNISLVRS